MNVILHTQLFYIIFSFELGNLKGEKLCFTLTISLGNACLLLSTLTLAVGMAAKITRGRNPKTMKLYL